MTPIYSLPNPEILLVAYIKTLDLPDGTVVSTDVPTDYDGSQYVVRIDRTGGPTEWPKADHPSVEISTFGPDKFSALTLCGIVRSGVTWMAMGAVDFSVYGARVSNPVERLGPQWFIEEGYPPAGSWKFEISLDLRNG